MRNTLCEFLIVIAAVAKVSCKHGLWLVAHVNKNAGNKDTMCFISCIFSFTDVCLNLLNFQNVCIAGASVYCTSGKDKVVAFFQ